MNVTVVYGVMTQPAGIYRDLFFFVQLVNTLLKMILKISSYLINQILRKIYVAKIYKKFYKSRLSVTI